ncbi:MAG: hypothetical protein DMD71_03875 [Gemmatimonadetes bacterium]|nr:MAG: hypothetical protein DMD71_03875 [Gemmatimonadota bacterium]
MNTRSFWAVPLALALAGTAPAQTPAPVIHRYAAGATGMFVNAYLVETPHGVVAIDATLTESDSKALRAQLDSLGKPLLAVLITHGHPDHYNGVTNLLAGRAVPPPVLATAGVDSVIRANDAAKEAQWKPLFGDEWPAQRTFPSRIVRDGESVTFDGATFIVHALGPGESYNDSYWVLQGRRGNRRNPGTPGAAFIGDVVLNGVHAYMADGHTAGWRSPTATPTTTMESRISSPVAPCRRPCSRRRASTA